MLYFTLYYPTTPFSLCLALPLSPSRLATTETMQMEALPAGLLLCCRGPWIPLVGGTPLANQRRLLVTYAPLIGHSAAYLPLCIFWDRPYMLRLPVCYFICFIVHSTTTKPLRKHSPVNTRHLNILNVDVMKNY